MKKITALLLCLVGFGPAYGAKFQTLEDALTQTAAKIAQNAFIPKNSKMAVVGFLESTSRVRGLPGKLVIGSARKCIGVREQYEKVSFNGAVVRVGIGGGYREVDLIAVNSWALVNVYIETYKDYELHDGILEWYVREAD